MPTDDDGFGGSGALAVKEAGAGEPWAGAVAPKPVNVGVGEVAGCAAANEAPKFILGALSC